MAPSTCEEEGAWRARDDAWWNGWKLAMINFTERHQRELICKSPVKSLEAQNEEAMFEAHTAEVAQLHALIEDAEVRLRESQSQRAILESVISERLESERNAVCAADSLRQSLRRASSKCNELEAGRENDRKESAAQAAVATEREQLLRRLQVELAEVESFMGSSDGSGALKLEAELASCRLALARVEEEKDELEAELASYQTLEEGTDSGEDDDETEFEQKTQNSSISVVAASAERRVLQASNGFQSAPPAAVAALKGPATRQIKSGKEN